jgi:peptidoglycan hydrolase CwlO-like protein
MKNKPIDNKTFNKVESMLYRYYRQKKELKDIQDKIIFLEKEIERIEKRIRTTDVI